jgi:hypothetical protein
MQRRRFAVADDFLQHPHAVVLERDVVDVRRDANRVQRGRDRCEQQRCDQQ